MWFFRRSFRKLINRFNVKVDLKPKENTAVAIHLISAPLSEQSHKIIEICW